VDDLGPRRDGVSAGDLSVSADEVTCQQFVELVTDYFEGTLTSRTLSHVEEHLVMCNWCVTYLEQMEATIRSLGELSDQPASEPSEALLSALSMNREIGR
jgi:predicted anti-sigma-YlaC factor YlaD